MQPFCSDHKQFLFHWTALNEALTGEVQRLKLGDTGSSGNNLSQQMQLRCQNNQMVELNKQQQQGEQIPFYQLEQNGASRNHEPKWGWYLSYLHWVIIQKKKNLSPIDDMEIKFPNPFILKLWSRLYSSILCLLGRQGPRTFLNVFYVLLRTMVVAGVVIAGEKCNEFKFFCSTVIYEFVWAHCYYNIIFWYVLSII